MKNILIATATLALLASPALAQEAAVIPKHSEASIQSITDQLELMRIPAEIEIAVDRKDWTRARSFFANELRVDFTSLVGGEPATIPADALIQGWSGNLKGNKESLHMRGDTLVTIDGDKATVYSNGYAYNRMPGATDGSGDLWEVWGNYTHGFVRTHDGWKVNAFTFVKTYERGSMWVKATPGT